MLLELSPKLLRLPTIKQNFLLQTMMHAGLTHFEVPPTHTIKLSTNPILTSEVSHYSAVKVLPPYMNEFVVTFNLAQNMSHSFEVLHSLSSLVPYVSIRARLMDCWDTEGCGGQRQACIIGLMCRFADLGVHSVDLCDSLGEATPKSTARLLSTVFKNHFPLNIGLGVKPLNLALLGVDMGVNKLLCSLTPTHSPCVDTVEVARALQVQLQYEDLHELAKLI